MTFLQEGFNLLLYSLVLENCSLYIFIGKLLVANFALGTVSVCLCIPTSLGTEGGEKNTMKKRGSRIFVLSKINVQGPVAQSNVSLTSLLAVKMLTVF